MKNSKTLLLLALMGIAATGLFSSCESDPDTDQSIVLSGEWRGDFGMFYNYGKYTFDCFDTRVIFYPQYNYATFGWGRQIDYYDVGPYEYQYYTFNWTIRYGVIYLTYPGAPELDTRISNYRMTPNVFYGRFPGSNSRFELYKVADYYDWGLYDRYGYYYGYGRPDWEIYYPYYRQGQGKTRPAPSPIDPSKIQRGNRFIQAGADTE